MRPPGVEPFRGNRKMVMNGKEFAKEYGKNYKENIGVFLLRRVFVALFLVFLKRIIGGGANVTTYLYEFAC